GITYTGDPTGDSSSVANDQAVTSMMITYTDGSIEFVGTKDELRDAAYGAYTDTLPEGATVPTNVYHYASSDTVAGETFRVGANRVVPITAGDATTPSRTATKTIASVDFSSVSYHGNENATVGVQSDTATYHFTTGAFTLYKLLDTEDLDYDPQTGVIDWSSTAQPAAGESDTVIPDNTDYMMAQSVNVDGTNVIAATLTLSDGSTLKVSSGFYELGCSVPVTTVSTIYDAQGNMHTVTLLTDKAAGTTGNAWRTYIAPTAGQKGYQTQVTQQEKDGTTTEIYLNRQVTEDDNTDPPTEVITTDKADMYFTTLGAIDTARTSGASLYLDYGNGNGAEVTTVAVDFNDVTQFSGSNTLYPTTDGNSLGLLNSVSVDVSGVITGTYTNGIIMTEAQIAVAQFSNPGGLTKTGTSLYQQSNNSGNARVGTVSDFGYSFTPSALEMSNVELASELVDMIITQRGFQSNSKVITVGDEMLETIVNMKR
ncbi:MAG: flagellar hook-basal body complex protein, partial [Selenomonadaceae bacterium]|nr:flagellar hook-basal body complex protein [Selenomonadaceae bacterium]